MKKLIIYTILYHALILATSGGFYYYGVNSFITHTLTHIQETLP